MNLEECMVLPLKPPSIKWAKVHYVMDDVVSIDTVCGGCKKQGRGQTNRLGPHRWNWTPCAAPDRTVEGSCCGSPTSTQRRTPCRKGINVAISLACAASSSGRHQIEQPLRLSCQGTSVRPRPRMRRVCIGTQVHDMVYDTVSTGTRCGG
jgi:hypothetical protein